MNIRIDNSSSIPIHRQLTEQIVFLIALGQFRAGDALPSVRELARRLRIHHNTVSQAYKELVRRQWLERRRGSRLTVRSMSAIHGPRGPASLDDLINTTIRLAQENGYTLQELRERVRERLLAEAPDHILVVERDAGLRKILTGELRTALEWPVADCTQEGLAGDQSLAIGALAVTAEHALAEVDALFPKERPVVPIRYASADEHLKKISALPGPSIIAVVSVSELFLEVARGVMAAAAGSLHELREILLPLETPAAARTADLVICDSIAWKRLRSTKAVPYRLILPESIRFVAATMRSYGHKKSGRPWEPPL
jgi:GntR family transcriptional regulator